MFSRCYASSLFPAICYGQGGTLRIEILRRTDRSYGNHAGAARCPDYSGRNYSGGAWFTTPQRETGEAKAQDSECAWLGNAGGLGCANGKRHIVGIGGEFPVRMQADSDIARARIDDLVGQGEFFPASGTRIRKAHRLEENIVERCPADGVRNCRLGTRKAAQ